MPVSLRCWKIAGIEWRPPSLGWDANGNLTSDEFTTFAYDTENRLTGASGAKTAALKYDPLGRLFEVSNTAGTTRFV